MGERTRRVMLRQVELSLVAAGAVLTALSCGGGDVTAPTTGSLEITTTTSGPEPDADGYAVTIDDGAESPLGANATLQRDNLEPGNHSVRLTGMAANCTVAGENPRNVSVPSGETATIAFQLTCSATTGSLAITTASSGPSPDPDGYSITLDGTDRGTLSVSGTVTLEALTTGSHAVGLSGVAANCQVQGDNPQTVTVTAGASVTAAFAVTCATPPPVTGTLRITTTTTGPDQEPNGYAFMLDAGGSQPIGVNATATLANVGAGAHTVRLSGVATNCSVQGTNPRSVTLTGGTTADVSFAITCTAAAGSLEITTTTTGGLPDPDGYTVTVDNAAPQTIGAAASLTVPAVGPGTHLVTLGGLATNCRVEGDNPRSVTVTAGATAMVAFSLDCAVPLTSKIAWAVANPDLGPRWRAEIYVMNADGSGKTRLTVGGDSDYEWSPDGSRIAYSLGRPNERESDLYVSKVDGSDDMQFLTSGLGPRWSPDGSRLAFVNDEGLGAVYVIQADGSGKTALAGTGASGPRWSPGGRRIVFFRSSDDGISDYVIPGIYVMNSDGSGQTQLTHHGRNAVWSPDGKTIAFSGSDADIYVMNADGSSQINLTNSPQWNDSSPAWSPDGHRIAFVSTQAGNGEIYVINADGSNQTNLTESPWTEEGPAWSPEGLKIAFAREAVPPLTDPSRDIWVMNADGTDQVQLTSGESSGTGDIGWYDDFNPSWSP